ncbi:MAG: endonuclease/exonuclease/phosphatase family protein [Clostridium sp.]|nr:endonuclease/exonuclease/phosphatase family protein [Clostridium sp.]
MKKRNRFLRAVQLTVNMLVSAFCLLTAYGGMADPVRTVIPALAAMLFPLALAAVVVILVIDLLTFRNQSWIPIAALALCASPIRTFCPLNFGGESRVRKAVETDSGRVFSLTTYNVCDFRDFTRDEHDTSEAPNPSIRFILDSGSDFVCLQEGLNLTASPRRNLLKSQVDSLKRVYPYRSKGKNIVSFLSRHPFEEILVPNEIKQMTFDAACYRTEIDGQTLHIVNLHLQSIGLNDQDRELYREVTRGEATNKQEIKEIRLTLIRKLARAFRNRSAQAKTVRRFLDTLDGNVIVCGDFNDVPGCYASRVIAGKDFSDAYRDGATGPCWTYNRDRFLFRIDQVYWRGEMDVLRTLRDSNRGSDHYPLTVWFELDKQTPIKNKQ